MVEYGGEAVACQGLRQAVGKILIGRNIFELKIAFFHPLSLPMIFYIQVFCFGMLYRVLGEVESRLVIPTNDSRPIDES